MTYIDSIALRINYKDLIIYSTVLVNLLQIYLHYRQYQKCKKSRWEKYRPLTSRINMTQSEFLTN